MYCILLIFSFVQCIFCDCPYTFTNLYNTDYSVDVEKDCSDIKCIRKCCNSDEILYKHSTEEKKFQCMNINVISLKIRNVTHKHSEELWNVAIYKDDNKDGSNIEKSSKSLSDFNILHANFPSGHIKSKRRTYILETGDILYEYESNSWYSFNICQYCVDQAIRNITEKDASLEIVYILINDEPNPLDDLNFTINGISMLVSLVFMVLSLLVYCTLPPLRNLFGMIFMAYIGTLSIFYLVQSIYLFSKQYFIAEHCRIYSAVAYFTILSSFFWLNVMAYEVWWGLRGFRLKREVNRRGELTQFGWYALYAFSLPAAMTIAVVIIDNHIFENWPNFPKPHFENCFYEGDGLITYLHTVIAVIMGLNCILFVLTIYNLWQIKKQLAVLSSDNNAKSKKNKNWFYTYFKISILMGISWVFDLIKLTSSSQLLHLVLSVINSCLGIPIFCIFICKKKILIMLCKRFHITNRFINNLLGESTHDKTHSSKTKSTNDTESEVIVKAKEHL